ncbi:MAG: Flp pilus assembly complex ATPase component TadA [Sedimentisphaerales bacterium]|nr:Flp pilus assembly complex ATPase component TadA [Sedimentisphaerales bacterium]
MAKIPPVSELKGRTIGRILIKMGLLTREKVHESLKVQQERKGQVKLGEVFLEKGFITQKDLRIALAGQRGMEYVDLENQEIPQAVIDQIPAQMARSYRIFPLKHDKSSNRITVAIDNPDNFRATDDLSTLLGFAVESKVTDTDSLTVALDKYYKEDKEGLGDLIGEIEGDQTLKQFQGRGESIDLEDIKELAESNPVKKLLNYVLLQAIRDKASDIHFEPFEEEFKMRYRIDGVLYEMVPPPKSIAVALSSRIKVMANLDIAERRLPQDGRIPLVVGGNPIDLRVSVLPTMFGESVVLRVLDRTQVDLRLDMLGLRPRELEMVNQLINKPNGIVVVTGPTGSGKTTTLYSCLKALNTIDTKIITTENPVEYDIDGLVQVQIRPEIGLTFARCLRSILRQDPDICMVGEIRDLETAEISIQASLTGHLVFTTLHTNDAPSTIARLLDLGLETFLVTATMEGIIAQRLVRKICNHCKTEYTPSEEQLMELELTHEDIKGKKLYYGRGCENCNNTGYRGRTGIYEIMIFNDEIRDLIMNHASTSVLREASRRAGMKTLRENGLALIYDGITTIDEVGRETIAAEA